MRTRSSYWMTVRSQVWGTHDELLKDCTVYQEIYYSQYPEQREVFGNAETNNKATMKRVLKYIRKYTPALVLSLLLAGLTVLLTLYIPILTGNAVDLIIGKGQVDMPGIFLL